MTIENRPAIRYHRVTTRRRTLHALQCPLEPELLVAEFGDELPPDIALAVREHIAVCDTCGARSHALRQPYELLSSLGAEPVHYVPDLRETVRVRARQGHFMRGVVRRARTVGGGGALVIASAIGVIALVVILLVVTTSNVTPQVVARSTNALAHPGAAAPSGMLVVETDKLVTVTDAGGTSRQIAEVLLVRQQDGKVIRSLPASTQALHLAAAGQLPRFTSVAPDGSYILELLGDASGYTLVAIDSGSGALRYAAKVRLPGGGALPAGASPTSVTYSPDGTTLYLGLSQADPTGNAPRVLVLNAANGSAERVLAPTITSPAPMPPPPGSLPVTAFPNAVPKLDISALPLATISQGAEGTLAVSPDGLWLYDLVIISQGQTPSYGLVRRIDANTGVTVQELAMSGDFTLARFVSAGGKLVLVKGSPDSEAFVLDTSNKGPKLVTDAALGGPGAPTGTVFSGTLSASISADGATLYVAQDVSAAGGLISGHDVWAVNLGNGTILSHLLVQDAAGTILGNGVAGDGALAFALRQGEVLVAAPTLRGTAKPWLVVAGGHPVIALLASLP